MKDALAVHRDLLGRGIAHEIVRLSRAIVAADDLPDALGLPSHQCLAVRMYVADGRLIAVCLPAGAVPSSAALREALGARRITAATANRVNVETDYTAGLVSPVLLPSDVPILVDSAFGASEVVYTPTGDSGTALGIHVRDLLVATRARVANLLTGGTPAKRATIDLTEPAPTAGRTRRRRGS